ncbi:MAG: hypothetical protein R3270_04065 [Gammaproteobacteria bacterium]|nr:hypothetical protein [Gammaproteobacteria bacterium]
MKKLILVGAAALLGASVANADTILEYRNAKDGSIHTMMKVSNQRVLVNDQNRSESMLYMQQGDRMYIIDSSKREYSTLDEETMKRLSGQVNDAMKQLEEQLANMPEAQREQMKKMMGGMMDMGKEMMKPEITRTGRSGEFNGMACDFVKMKVGNMMNSELCVAEMSALDMPGNDRATLDAMNAYMKKISDMMSESLGMNIPFNLIGGIPVYISDDETPEGRVLHIDDDASISGSEMSLPDGYREVPLEGKGGGMGGFGG